MKLVPILLAATVGAVGAGHYVLWQQQVNAFENQITRLEDSMQKKHGKKVLSFTYDSKETGGYPADAVVTYVNPVLSVDESAYGSNNAERHQLQSVRIDGAMTVRNGIVQNSYGVEMTGTKRVKGIFDAKPFEYLIAWDGTAGCAASLSDSPLTFISGEHKIIKAKSFEDYVRAISGVSCHASKVAVDDVLDGGKRVADIADYQFALDSKPAGSADTHHIGFDIRMDDAVVHTSQEHYFQDLRDGLGELPPQEASIIAALSRQPLPPILDSKAYGEQDVVLKGHYEGPLKQPETFSLAVDEFTMTSKLYEMHFPVTVNVDERAHSVQVRHEGTLRFTKRYDDVMQASADIVLAALRDPEVRLEDPELQALVAALDARTLGTLIPPMHPAGDIRLHANLDVANRTQLSIDKAGLETDQFGLTVGGKGDFARQYADMQVVCRHCDVMLAKITDYANGIAALMYAVGEAPSPEMVTQAALKDAIGFISSYDTDQDPDTVTITLKNGQGGDLAVSGEPLAMVMMKAMGTFAAHAPGMNPMAQ